LLSVATAARSEFLYRELTRTLRNIKTTNASADADFKQQDSVIAFRNLFRDHTGAAQGTIIRAVLDEDKISRKFHCFVSDNALGSPCDLVSGIRVGCRLADRRVDAYLIVP
jgi:hypothetical protein